MAKLSANAKAIISYLQTNGRTSTVELASALGIAEKSLNGSLISLGTKGPKAKGFVDYEKVAVEGQEKPVKYVFLTEAGSAVDVNAEDAE